VSPRPGWIRLLAACALACAAATAGSAAPIRAGNAASGRAKADDERCIECHVARDPATAQPGDGLHALLDGQSSRYLARQFADFRSGTREHAVMTLVARNLDDADLADILAWYAARPWRPGTGSVVDAGAARLYGEGDPARGLLACAGCHGGPGQPPVTPDTPRIAGQDAAYLAAQLQRWRSGERRDSAGAAMTRSARLLSDAEIQSLANAIAAMN
jgi:cytochrome c553